MSPPAEQAWIARLDRELGRRTASARGATQRRMGRHLRTTGPGTRARAAGAYRRASAGGARGGSGARTGGTFHFALSRTGSRTAAMSHQHYLEREEACVYSVGTLAENLPERAQVWSWAASGRPVRTGWIEVDPQEAPTPVRRAWREAVPARSRPDDRWRTTSPERWRAVDRALRTAAGRARIPGIRRHAPREPIVQRRLIAELAHELSPEGRAWVLDRWCREVLGPADVGYHGVIHAPERGNDPRNWHAHVVFTNVSVKGLEQGLPPPRQGDWARALGGNGPRGRAGARAVVHEMRERWCTLQNEALEREGHPPRYDARSYAAQGIDTRPGRHLGPARSARRRESPDTDEELPSRLGGGRSETQEAEVLATGLAALAREEQDAKWRERLEEWAREWRHAAQIEQDTQRENRTGRRRKRRRREELLERALREGRDRAALRLARDPATSDWLSSPGGAVTRARLARVRAREAGRIHRTTLRIKAALESARRGEREAARRCWKDAETRARCIPSLRAALREAGQPADEPPKRTRARSRG